MVFRKTIVCFYVTLMCYKGHTVKDKRSILSCLFLGGFLALGLWEKNRVNVWKDTTLGDGDGSKEFVELLIVSDSKLDVSWDDSGLLVVSGGVTGKLKDLGSQVLKDGSKVHWGTGTDTSGVLSLLQESADTADWELKTGLGRSRGGFSAGSTSSLSSFSSFSGWWHD